MHHDAVPDPLVAPERDAWPPERSGLADLLELSRLVKLIDGYEMVPGAVRLAQRGARFELDERQARAFLAGALNYTTWSYMTAYPLHRDGRACIGLPEANRLLQREPRARA